MSTVTFLHDPDCNPSLHKSVARMHEPEAGTVVLFGEPGKNHTSALFGSLLARLGKSQREYGHTRAPNDSEGYALAWLAAEQVRRLVVLDATLLGKSVKPLALTALAAGTDVVLFTDGPLSNHFRAAVAGLAAGRPQRPTAWLAHVSAAPRPPEPVQHSRTAGFGAVPRTGFLTFRADMRRSLPREEFQFADDLYRHAFEEARAFDFAGGAAGAFVHEALVRHTERSAQTVVLRAVQAAAFHQGVHLSVDTAMALDALEPAARVGNLTAAEWRRMDVWVRPFYMAVVALTSAGLMPDGLVGVPAHAVSLDGSAVVSGAGVTRVPELAQKFLRAQHVARRWFGHGPDEPFLADRTTASRRGVIDALNLLSRTHGIPLRRRGVEAEQSTTWWLNNWGVRVAPLGSPT